MLQAQAVWEAKTMTAATPSRAVFCQTCDGTQRSKQEINLRKDSIVSRRWLWRKPLLLLEAPRQSCVTRQQQQPWGWMSHTLPMFIFEPKHGGFRGWSQQLAEVSLLQSTVTALFCVTWINDAGTFVIKYLSIYLSIHPSISNTFVFFSHSNYLLYLSLPVGKTCFFLLSWTLWHCHLETPHFTLPL